MNKFTILSLCALFLLANCGGDAAKNESNTVSNNVSELNSLPSNETVEVEQEEVVEYDTNPDAVLLGNWIGEMNGKKIVIVIKSISNNKIGGLNILGKNERPIEGTFIKGSWDQPCSMAYEATLAEPGDEKWDGVFTIKFVGYEKETETENGLECNGNPRGVEAFGSWVSNNGKLNHNFTLQKDDSYIVNSGNAQ